MFYLNKYFHSFFSPNFSPSAKHTHPVSHSLEEPKERVVNFRALKYITVSNNPPFTDQVIIMVIINKAQKDCALPVITFLQFKVVSPHHLNLFSYV